MGWLRRHRKTQSTLGWWLDVRLVHLFSLVIAHPHEVSFPPRIIAQLLGPSRDFENAAFGGHQYASFDWNDLLAISPWMEEFITQKIDGPGLGH